MAGIIIVIGLFVMLGILFFLGKGASLIAGYNTMPKDKRAQYNTPALCKFMGKLMFALTFAQLFWLMDKFYPGYHLFTIGLVFFCAALLSGMMYANTGNRFRKK